MLIEEESVVKYKFERGVIVCAIEKQRDRSINPGRIFIICKKVIFIFAFRLDVGDDTTENMKVLRCSG